MKNKVLSSRVHWSGNANNGSNAGFGNSNANNSPSNANANIGSQLCYVINGDMTSPLGEKNRLGKGVSRSVENSIFHST